MAAAGDRYLSSYGASLRREAAAQIARRHGDAERKRARLVTTAKDILRVPPEMRTGIEVLEIEICWVDPAALHEFLRPLLISALGNGRSSANPDP